MTDNPNHTSDIKSKTVRGVLWRIAEQGGNQLISFIVSVILARLIAPDQFGMIAMITVFLTLANVFIDSGFSTALIRKNNRTPTDCSTVYWFNILVSIICYIILYFCAPLIAEFYNMPDLSSILRVLSLSIIIGSLSGVHRSLLQADMNFKALMKYNLLGLIISGIIGIILAYLDFKVWALVYQSLTGTILGTIFIFYKVKWRPTFVMSMDSFKEFFGFGWKMLASSILNTIFNNLYTIVIGKIYKASELAFYNRSYSLSSLTSSTPTGILQSVTFPALCKLQDNDNSLRNGYRRIIKLSAFVIFPMTLGLGAVAYPLINVLFTNVWIYSASLLSIIVFGVMWYPIHSINLNYLIVKGRSDLFFRLEIIKKIISVVILVTSIPFGLEAICWGSVIGSLLCLVLNTYYTGKYLHMGIVAQIKDILHILILSLVMFAGARCVAMVVGNGILSLILSIFTGIAIYAGGALLFRFPEVRELKNIRK